MRKKFEQQPRMQPVALECRLCGELSNSCYEYMVHGGAQVCGECSDTIANAFWKQHSGEYLTWHEPNGRRIGYKSQIDETLRWKIFQRDKFSCKQCGSQSCLHADHIIAESKGGPTTLENLQTLCRTCNLKKGAK